MSGSRQKHSTHSSSACACTVFRDSAIVVKKLSRSTAMMMLMSTNEQTSIGHEEERRQRRHFAVFIEQRSRDVGCPAIASAGLEHGKHASAEFSKSHGLLFSEEIHGHTCVDTRDEPQQDHRIEHRHERGKQSINYWLQTFGRPELTHSTQHTNGSD